MTKKETAASKTKKSGSSVPVVDSLATALSLLNYFSTVEPELSLQQLCDRSGLYKSRVHRLCATLVLSGFLIRMPWATYRLGPKLMTLGKIYEATNSLITLSRPVMKDLAMDTGESVALFGLEGNSCYCLARELGSSRLIFSIQEGHTMELHASAAGRVLMAFGSPALTQDVLSADSLKQFTPETLIDKKKIKARLSAIKERGYDINKGERELEIAAIAAPIFDFENQVRSALAIVGPGQRFSDEKIPDMVALLSRATRKISELMGAPLPS